MRSARVSGSQPTPNGGVHYRAPSKGGTKDGAWTSPTSKLSTQVMNTSERQIFKELTSSAIKSHSRDPQPATTGGYTLDSYRNASGLSGQDWNNQASRSRSSSKHSPSVALTNELRNFSRKKQRDNLLRNDSGRKWAQSTKEPFSSIVYKDANLLRLEEAKLSFKEPTAVSRTYNTKPIVLAADRKGFLNNYSTSTTQHKKLELEAPSPALYSADPKELRADDKKDAGTGSRLAHEWTGIRMHGFMDPDANIAGLRSKLAQTLSSSRANRVTNKKYILEAGNSANKNPVSQRCTDRSSNLQSNLVDGSQQSQTTEVDLARVRDKIQEVLHNLDEEKRIFEAKYEDVCSSITQARAEHDQKMKGLQEIRALNRKTFEQQLKDLLNESKPDHASESMLQSNQGHRPKSGNRQCSLDVSLVVSHVPDSGSSPPHNH
jgi:hypothetical protein